MPDAAVAGAGDLQERKSRLEGRKAIPSIALGTPPNQMNGFGEPFMAGACTKDLA
jgi:hypothetical protein